MHTITILMHRLDKVEILFDKKRIDLNKAIEIKIKIIDKFKGEQHDKND